MSEQLVILPGLMCDSRMFGRQIDAFGAVVVDGFYGGASRIGKMADWALARMPTRAALLGHSMGARVALEIYRRAPDRVTRLALADTGVHPARPGEAEKRYALRDLGREQGIAALVDIWLPPMIGPTRRDDAGLVSTLRAMAVDAGIDIYEAQIEALLCRPVLDDLLPAITCPVTAIVGRDDEWSPVAQHEAFVAAMPGALLSIVEAAGHMAPAEQPDDFNEAVRTWLDMPANDIPL